MAKRMIRAMGILVAALALSACVTAPVVPPLAGVYTNIEAPLDLASGDQGKVIGPKRGESSSIAILGLVAVGNAGVYKAAQEAGITRVNHLDYHFKNYLFGVYAKYTTIVYGE
ncbi:hypothetical protein HQ520_06525 [bacterium]|nr:hypothetical protein [bacterium]